MRNDILPKLNPTPLSVPHRNENSAYDRLAFIADHYEDLEQMYRNIMEHLSVVNTNTIDISTLESRIEALETKIKELENG